LLKLGVITDVHFGPEAHFGGKLRKLTAQAPALVKSFATRMRDVVRPDLVVNLGDCIEDESREIDLKRYRACLDVLRGAKRELVHVAGNHDRINLTDEDLRAAWGTDGGLFRSFDHGGIHVVVLATHETTDVDVRIDDGQLAWLDHDLASTRLPTIVLMHHSAADQDLVGQRWFEDSPHLCLVQELSRLRTILGKHGRTMLVLNGHLHWNHLAVIDGIPYVTLQSLIENLDDDAPGRAAAAHAVVTLDPPHVHVQIEGLEPARYQFTR
jgi:calcineurin-like phosphoesterase family protein